MFGIVLDDLLPSQRNLELITIANEMKAQVFTKCLTRSCKALETTLMDISEIWDYNSLLIATSIDTYRFVRNAITGSEKMCYVYDPDEFKLNDHEEIADIQIPLFGRSELHCMKIYQITGKKAEVMNWEQIEKWRDK
jgi:hypothetical protein